MFSPDDLVMFEVYRFSLKPSNLLKDLSGLPGNFKLLDVCPVVLKLRVMPPLMVHGIGLRTHAMISRSGKTKKWGPLSLIDLIISHT